MSLLLFSMGGSLTGVIMSKPYIIAFANQKGGVGKTTSCVNIASAAAERGYKTLLIDEDPQGNTTSGVGVAKKNIKYSTYELLLGGCSLSDAAVKTEFDNLYVIPSTLNLAGAEFDLIDLDKREARLRAALDGCADYDLILIDCPPSLSLLTLNALCAANGVVIPMQAEYYALEGLTQLMLTIQKVKKLYNSSLTILGILITMYNGRYNLSQAVLAEVKKYYSAQLLETPIPRSVKLSEAPSYGTPINYHDKYSKAAEAYKTAAEEILRRIGMIV